MLRRYIIGRIDAAVRHSFAPWVYKLSGSPVVIGGQLINTVLAVLCASEHRCSFALRRVYWDWPVPTSRMCFN